MARPNFLLITTDQQRPDAMGYETPRLKTPNLDALAERGIIFERAYTTNPTCTPARASILTGHYPSRHGAYMVGTSLPEDYPTLAEEMTEAGYFTGLLGKAHFRACLQEGSFEAAPHIFDRRFFRSWDGPYYGFDHAQLCIGHTAEKHAAGMHYLVWLENHGVDTSRYFGGHDYSAWGAWDLHIYYVVPEPWSYMDAPADLPLFSGREGEMEDKPPLYQSLLAGERYGDPQLEGVSADVALRPRMDEGKRREMMAAYMGMLSLMDHHVGRIIEHLEKAGLMEDTVIVFTSDHGEYSGNHGLWGKGLPAYEDVQRVPFTVYHPDCDTPGQRSRALQSVVDIFPTALAKAGLELPAGVQGLDQSPAWTDAEESVRDWAMVEARPAEGPFMQKTYIEENHKLVLYHDRPYGELYDLEADPDQFYNLWDEPDHRELRAQLLRRFISAEMEKDGVLLPRPVGA